MRFSNLNDWLTWQESLHPEEIDLGLERVTRVWQRMSHSLDCTIISVAGTNGKGSSIAMLEAIYLAAGYRVGTYTSPHLYRYNERVCIDGEVVSDSQLVDSFEMVDRARLDEATGKEISLTFFEFGTLAALQIFSQSNLDLILLEVGLGGRLDAVNIVDNDLALITSIDIDHQAWLGETRDEIAREKAGILRAGKTCVISDPTAPLLIEKMAERLGCECYRAGQSFDYQIEKGQWRWHSGKNVMPGLPIPALNGEQQLQNAAGVIKVIETMQSRLPVPRQAIRAGLLSACLAGRFEIRPGRVSMVLDVAHNPAAAQSLADSIGKYAGHRRIHCVFSLLADKDIENVVRPLLPLVSHWIVVPLAAARRMPVEGMVSVIETLLMNNPPDLLNQVTVETCNSVREAIDELKNSAAEGDVILVYGSFYTVAEAGREPV